MAALQAFGGATGVLALAGSGLTPARLLLVPAGTRLPPGALVARAAAGAGHGHGLPSSALAAVSVNDSARAGVLAVAALSVNDDVTKEGAGAGAGALAYLVIDDSATDDFLSVAGALAYLVIDDSATDDFLSVAGATRAAAGGPVRGSAGPLRFFGGDAPAALASAEGGRGSFRGGRLVVAATAGSGADGEVDIGADSPKVDQFLKEKKEEVLLSWEFVDVYRNYQAHGFSGDVKMFEDSAYKGMVLMRVLLVELSDCSNDNLWVLSYAGQCLRRVELQAKDGFVYDGAVTEATEAVKLVCLKLLPETAIGSASDPIVAYSKQRAEDFVKLIDGVKDVVTTA